MLNTTFLHVLYHLDEDDKESARIFVKIIRLPNNNKCQVRILHNDILLNKTFWNEADAANCRYPYFSIHNWRNKDTLTIEVWEEMAVIAGGIFQIDTQQEDYLLHTVCSNNIDLFQDASLRDMIDDYHDLVDQYNEATQGW